jgi:hypothetical protein
MKKAVLLFVMCTLIFVFLSCSSNGASEHTTHSEEDLIGRWKYTQEYINNSDKELVKILPYSNLFFENDGTYYIDYGFETEDMDFIEFGNYSVDNNTVVMKPDNTKIYTIKEYTISDDNSKLFFIRDTEFMLEFIYVFERT